MSECVANTPTVSNTPETKPTKRAAHGFVTLDSYVRAVFRECAAASAETHDLKLTAAGASALSDALHCALLRIVDASASVVDLGGDEQMMMRHIEAALHLVADEPMAETLAASGARAVDAFRKPRTT